MYSKNESGRAIYRRLYCFRGRWVRIWTYFLGLTPQSPSVLQKWGQNFEKSRKVEWYIKWYVFEIAEYEYELIFWVQSLEAPPCPKKGVKILKNRDKSSDISNDMFSKSLSTNMVLFFAPNPAKLLTAPKKSKILKISEKLSDISNCMFSKSLSTNMNNCFSANDSSKPSYAPLNRIKLWKVVRSRVILCRILYFQDRW